MIGAFGKLHRSRKLERVGWVPGVHILEVTSPIDSPHPHL